MPQLCVDVIDHCLKQAYKLIFRRVFQKQIRGILSYLVSSCPPVCPFVYNSAWTSLPISTSLGMINLHQILSSHFNFNHAKDVPFHQGMAHSQAVDGRSSLEIWRVAAKVLNMQLRPTDKRWSSSCRNRKNIAWGPITKCYRHGFFFGTT
jgi:hypothetical protein